MFKHVSSVLVALALITVIVSCSSAPQTEMKVSEDLLNEAKMAEVEQYAPESFQQALDTLNAAKVEIQAQDGKFALLRSYGDSKKMLLSANEILKGAMEEAVQNKESVRIADSTALVRLTALAQTADSMISKAPRGKGTKADIELFKTELATVRQIITSSDADYKAGKYLAVKAQLEAVETKLYMIINDISSAKRKS